MLNLFEAQRLRSKLNVVARGDVGCLVARAVLVFHRIGCAIGFELDHVGLADQPQRLNACSRWINPHWRGQ